ncbi:MAG: hypothetical protein V4614_14990 [Pseudomonadota bacterium]
MAALKNRRRPGLNLVERAVIANEWRHVALEAQMLAMCSLDGEKVVNKAGRMLFVVLGACIADGVEQDDPNIRILRGAVNAVHDQAGEKDIPHMRRQSIVIGLQTAAALIPELNRKSLVDAACDLALKLRAGDVKLSDFEAILNPKPAAVAA